MAQPPAYTKNYSYTDWSTSFPSTPHAGVRLDSEFDEIEIDLGEIPEASTMDTDEDNDKA
jgi:hypothetical protein